MNHKGDIWIARIKLINPIFEVLYGIPLKEGKNIFYSEKINHKLNFGILSFANDKFSPYAVERLNRDNNEIFIIGDHVSNGTKMNGRIERFELSDDLKSLYVYTDWSGVGMSIDDIYKVTKL